MHQTSLSRRILRVLALVVSTALLLVAAVVLLFLLSGQETRRDLLIGAVETFTGDTLHLGEPFRLELGRELLLEAGDLQWNEQQGEAGFQAQKVLLRFPLLPLMVDRRLELTLHLEESRLDLVWSKEKESRDSGELPITLVPVDIRINRLSVYRVPAGKEDSEARTLLLDHAGLHREGSMIALDVGGRYLEFPIQLQTRSSQEADGQEGGQRIELSGTLGRLKLSGRGWQAPWSGNALPDFGLQLHLQAPGLRIFDGRLLPRVPDMGPLEGDAELQWDGTLSARNLSLQLKDKTARLDVKGEIGDLLTGGGMKIRLEAVSPRPAELLKRWDVEVPPLLNELKATAFLQGDYGQPQLAEIRIDGGGEHLKLLAEGEVKDLLTGEGLDLALQADSTRAGELLKSLGADIPEEIDQLHLAGRLGGPWNEISLRQIALKLDGEALSFEASGEASALNDPERLKLRLEGEGTADRQPVQLSFELDGKARPPLAFILAMPGVKLHGKGSYQADGARWHSEMEIEGSAEDLSRVGKLLQVKLDPAKPVRAGARLILEPHRYQLKNLELLAGQSDLGGELLLVRGQDGRSRIEGTLESRRFDLNELLPQPDRIDAKLVDKGEKITPDELEKAERSQLFSDEPIELEWLANSDLDLRFRVGALMHRKILLNRLAGDLRLRARKLGFTLDEGLAGGKPLKIDFNLDGTEKTAKWSLKLDLEEARLGELFPALQLPGDSGTLTLKTALHSQGANLETVVAGLEGKLTLLLNSVPFVGTMPNELGRPLMSRLDPAAYEKGNDRLECAAFYVEFAEGFARTPRRVALQFPQVTWIGSGVLDLKSEKILLKLTPYPRTGLGISLKGLADVVAVSGTISRPYIVIDPGGALKTYFSWAAAAATGGASLLVQGYLEKQLASSGVCKRIAEGDPKQNEAKTPAPGKKTSKKPTSLDILDH